MARTGKTGLKSARGKAARPRKAVSRARSASKPASGKPQAKAAAGPAMKMPVETVHEKAPAAQSKMQEKVKQPCCCSNVDLGQWHMKEMMWSGKPFYVVKYWTFFRIPLGMPAVMKKGMETAANKYFTSKPEFWLSKDMGLFGAKMLFAVKETEARTGDPAIERLSGRFVTRGFKGPYKDIGNFIRVFSEQVMQKYGRKPDELYFWYTNCPRCAKEHGGTKTVMFARV